LRESHLNPKQRKIFTKMLVKALGQHGNPYKRCVISLGIGKKIYKDCLLRLEESLYRVGFDGDFIYWNDYFPEGCSEHFDAPFGFKPFCFYEARNLGYRQILWIDSPCVAIRSLQPVFESMKENGYILFNNNYSQTMGQWSSDEALATNAISREEALLIPEIPCSVLGLDVQDPRAQQFLEQWHQIMSDGVTAKGTKDKIRDWEDYQSIAWNRNNRISSDIRVKGHRHDQTAAGIVAHRLGMQPYSDYLKDIHYQAKPVKRNTIILHHREFGESITPLSEIYYRVFFKTPFVDNPRSFLRKLRSVARGFRTHA
jgi:hypothetical protein